MFHQTKADEVLYGGAAGGGKAVSLDTLIPTSRGFVTMADIVVGDEVYGRDGHTHPVTHKSPVMRHEAYRFIFDDGAEVVCDKEHLWFTYDARDLAAMTRQTDEYRARRRATRQSRRGGNRTKSQSDAIVERNSRVAKPVNRTLGTVRTAAEIADTLKTCSGRSNHAVPVAEPLVFPAREFTIDPYILGLWLGDGATSGGAFTSADGLENAFADAGYEVSRYGSKYGFGIRGIVTQLRSIGVYGHKHIPEEYFMGSVEQRLALLQGLMDTDGTCNKNGTAEFCGVNRELVDGVAMLIRTLGMKCKVRCGRAKLRGVDCGEKYNIKFKPNVYVFRLERKRKRQNIENRRTTRLRYLVAAEPVGETDVQCIAIDSADHLYLAGEGLVPTHNSKACVMDALFRCLKHPGTNAYLFRRTYRELEDTLIQEAQKSIPPAIGQYKKADHDYVLCNGSKLCFRHCQNEADRFKYQGAEIHWLYVDELTHFTKLMYDYFKSRLRANVALGIKPLARCTSNPGGTGHAWVKAYFVDSAPYYEIHEMTVHSTALNEDQVKRIQYIPAYATDNPHISKDYVFELEQKPEALRRALLNGDWDAFEGQAFPEYADDPEHYGDGFRTHIIEPFEIPDWWPRWRSMDFGYAKPFSIGWWAIGPDGCAYRYREWYGCEKNNPDVGIKIAPREIAKGILEREEIERIKGIRFNGVADPSIADESRGESIEKQMADEGVYWDMGDNKRLPGKMQVHYRLRFRDNGRPMLYAFEGCADFRRLIPAMSYDTKKPEDIDTKSEDHLYDEVRYFCMANPVSGVEPREEERREWSPFD